MLLGCCPYKIKIKTESECSLYIKKEEIHQVYEAKNGGHLTHLTIASGSCEPGDEEEDIFLLRKANVGFPM